jgi:hypothetical protein
MGAASSVAEITESYIYISYNTTDKFNLYIEILRDELRIRKYNVIYSELTTNSIQNISYGEILKNIQIIMQNTNHFIVCISKETIYSYYQAIEIDTALNSYKEILYLMLDEFYTPLNNRCVKGIVGHNKWLPFYRNKHAFDVIDYLVKLS